MVSGIAPKRKALLSTANSSLASCARTIRHITCADQSLPACIGPEAVVLRPGSPDAASFAGPQEHAQDHACWHQNKGLSYSYCSSLHASSSQSSYQACIKATIQQQQALQRPSWCLRIETSRIHCLRNPDTVLLCMLLLCIIVKSLPVKCTSPSCSCITVCGTQTYFTAICMPGFPRTW